MDEQKLDYLGPAFIMAAVIAGVSDIVFIFGILSAPIPLIGLVFLGLALLARYLGGLMTIAFVLPKLKHFIPKLVLFLAWLIPIPFLLSAGLIATIILQNKVIEALAIQAAVIALGAVTGGVGAVAGEAAVATAEAGTVAAEAGAIAAEAGTVGTEAGQLAAGAGALEAGPAAEAGLAEEAASAAKEIPPEALGEEKTPLEKLQELTEKIPEGPGSKESRDEDEEKNVEIDDETNEVNLKK